MLSSSEILSNYHAAAVRKTEMSIARLLLLGAFAGAFIALAGFGSALASLTVSRLAGAVVFPGGLAMVVFCGAELFTGNNLMLASLASGKIKTKGLLKNWLFVYIGNLLGALFVVLCCHYGGCFSLLDGSLALSLIKTAETKAGLSFIEAFLRGVLCNVLVCVAVWTAMGAKSAAGKLCAMFFPITLFVLCGFEHSIANMFYIPAGILAFGEYGGLVTGESGLAAAGPDWLGFLKNLLPVTLGNVLGGGVIAGLGMWAGFGGGTGR